MPETNPYYFRLSILDKHIGRSGLELPSGYYFFCMLGKLSNDEYLELTTWLKRYWKGDFLEWLRDKEDAYMDAKPSIRKLPKNSNNPKKEKLLRALLSGCDDFERGAFSKKG